MRHVFFTRRIMDIGIALAGQVVKTDTIVIFMKQF